MNDSQLLLYHQQLNASNSYLGRHDNTVPGPGYHFHNDSRYLYSHPLTPGREKPVPFVLHMVGRVSAQGNFTSLKKSISSLLIPNPSTDKIKISGLRRSALLGRARAGPFPEDWPHAISKLRELTKLLTKSNTEPTRNLWFNEGGNVDDTHVKFGAPCFKPRGYGEPPDGRLADLISPHQQTNPRWTEAAPYISLLDFNLIDHTGAAITDSMLPDAMNGATVDIAFILRGWKFAHEKFWSFALDIQQVVILRPEQNDINIASQIFQTVTPPRAPPRHSSSYQLPTPITPSNNNIALNSTYPTDNFYDSNIGTNTFALPLDQGSAPSSYVGSRENSSTFDATVSAAHGPSYNSRGTINTTSANMLVTPQPAHGGLSIQNQNSAVTGGTVMPSISPYGVLKADATMSSAVVPSAHNTMMGVRGANAVASSLPYHRVPPPQNKGLHPINFEDSLGCGYGGRRLLYGRETVHPDPQQQSGSLIPSIDEDFEARLMNAVKIARMQHMSHSLTDSRIIPGDNIRNDLHSPFALRDNHIGRPLEQQVFAEEFDFMNDRSTPFPMQTATQTTVVMPKFAWDDGDSFTGIIKVNDGDGSHSVEAGEPAQVIGNAVGAGGTSNANVGTNLGQSSNPTGTYTLFSPLHILLIHWSGVTSTSNNGFLGTTIPEQGQNPSGETTSYPLQHPPSYPASNGGSPVLEKVSGKGKKRAIAEDVGPSVVAKVPKIDTNGQRRPPVATAV
ncbi:hypothetical protein F5877DRAFT_67621 [Lentinula edodes]|nr:hypothetical protein F5877DRAFT_67621 [Lentinula edodes]